MGMLTGASLRQGVRTGRLTALTESNIHIAWEGKFGPEEQMFSKNSLPDDLEVLVLDGGWQKLSENLTKPAAQTRSATADLIEELQQITEKKHSPFKYQSHRGPGPGSPGKCKRKNSKYFDKETCKKTYSWPNRTDAATGCWDCRKVSPYLQKCTRTCPRSEADSARVKYVKVKDCWKSAYNQKYKQERGYGAASEKRQTAKSKLAAAREAARKGGIASVGETEKRADKEAATKKEASRVRKALNKRELRAKRTAARKKLASAKAQARRGSIAGIK